LIGSWSTPIRITGDKGENAPEMQVRYSPNNDGTEVYTTFDSNRDIYMQTSTDNGVTWS
jgi:hypothetical protein